MSRGSDRSKMCCQACGRAVSGHPSLQDCCRGEIESRKHLLKLLALIRTRSDNLGESSIVLAVESFLSDFKGHRN
jgi:hypothetical protein